MVTERTGPQCRPQTLNVGSVSSPDRNVLSALLPLLSRFIKGHSHYLKEATLYSSPAS